MYAVPKINPGRQIATNKQMRCTGWKTMEAKITAATAPEAPNELYRGLFLFFK
jgi:hypothetical protein